MEKTIKIGKKDLLRTTLRFKVTHSPDHSTSIDKKFDFIRLVAEGRITVINNYLQNYQAQSHEGICN